MPTVELTEMDEEKLRSIVRESVHQAFREIGLHDENAGKDVHDLRALISDWRELRRVIWATVYRWGTMIVLGLLSLGAWSKFHGNGE
jgi:hypothetical protein